MRRITLALMAILVILPAIPLQASGKIMPVWYPWPKNRLRIAVLPVRRVFARMRVVATSYCLPGTTATGTRAGLGTVAVDPSLIPLGSRIYVQGYGYGRATDTGSAIIGRHVDVWLPPAHDCRASWTWGRRMATVEILGPRMRPTSGMRAAMEEGLS